MSLMSRVAQTGTAHAVGEDSHAVKLAELKRRMGSELSPDELARIMAMNPVRAENEVRTACEKVLDADPWFAHDREERELLVNLAVDGIFGLGALEPLLADGEVTEIMVNPGSAVFVERSGILQPAAVPVGDGDAVRALVDRILGPLGRRIDESMPMVDARLSSGHRVNAVIPPVSPDGPAVTVRKFRDKVFTLDEMCAAGSFDGRMAAFLRLCIESRLNLAVSGATGSGKTTLLNTLSCQIPSDERIVTIEDSAELRFAHHPNIVRLEARLASAEGTGEVTIRDLVRNSLRMRPDRIIVGEVRDAAALDMLQAMNTGHDGSLTTLHANSERDAVLRLVTMVRFAADLPVDVIEAQVATAIDIVVQTARARSGMRYVSGVSELSFDREARCCVVRPLFVREQDCDAGTWVDRPCCLVEAGRAGRIDQSEVDRWLSRTFSH